MQRILAVLAVLLALIRPGLGAAPDTFTVHLTEITDLKAVFATVESRNVVPARTRIGGTITSLSVNYGDEVKKGQVIAVVTDHKLVLQRDSLAAEITGLRAQVAQAQVDLARAQTLVGQGAVSRQQYDRARTALDVAQSALRARIEQRAVVEQQLKEGEVLAPTSGRVLNVPYTTGTVVSTGDTVATVAEQDFVLRLEVPERETRFLKAGDLVRVDEAELGHAGVAFGKITLVYPEVRNGRVFADATASGLGTYFVGERVLVWIPADRRPAYIIPSDFIETLFGIDYVRLERPNAGVVPSAGVIMIPIQRGEPHPTPAMPGGIEVLSGLRTGDVLVRP
ncbi:MAG: efflux RND transporter periplasmic adaptor subunit [Rhodospirillales bacterium]|nr:efflux RND transporter periplasmic adaptor subunit [Rhodospirillales bacterium]